ncbi:MAG: C4-dicarboxylate ABC transporter, partial [Desulfuromonadales bacterium]|nr:C4-dicarboxylate ABC transporter [Desulfuromonadales bacterium]NIS43471.1 C4-dicarboxylate ABC transporter [Desulfuromonadales bacterium]
TNELFWDELSDEQRAIISEAMMEATRFARLKADELNKSYLQRIRSSGMIAVHELTPEQRKK